MSSASWRDEYKSMRLLTDKQLKLLDYGARCVTDSWQLMGMYNHYRRIKGLTPPERGNYQSSFKEFNRKHCKD